MALIKEYKNGLRLIAKRIEGLLSVTAGVLVYTGSANEDDENNGISHFIEHTVFKGTKKRTAFEISDYIDSIGAQINAFTSKETTCYYTKSTSEHIKDSLEVLSDIFFNSVFDKKELAKEKGVIIEEINMCEDSPEELCLDLLAKAYYGDQTLGRTILGPKKNIKSFGYEDVKKYMDEYYTADNVVISIAGNINEKEIEKLVDDLFFVNFTDKKSKGQAKTTNCVFNNEYKSKNIEQAHIGISFPSFNVLDERMDAFNIANIVLGGGMSSRLFQKIREEQGLCYSIYSYPSYYKDNGTTDIYAGVSLESRDQAFKSILDEIEKFREHGITEQELIRGKEQMKSSLILGQESTSSQMLLYGKTLMFLNRVFNFNEKLKKYNSITLDQVNEIIKGQFDVNKMATATLGKARTPLIK